MTDLTARVARLEAELEFAKSHPLAHAENVIVDKLMDIDKHIATFAASTVDNGTRIAGLVTHADNKVAHFDSKFAEVDSALVQLKNEMTAMKNEMAANHLQIMEFLRFGAAGRRGPGGGQT